MSDMDLAEYLSRGGKLTSPVNVPPRYRGELLRLMASFVDSELAASAGFADVINDAPGIKSRIAAARIVLEKADHAGQVLEVMAGFGVETARYEGVHPWSGRLPRDADIGARRHGGDMRLSVFQYPLQGWADAVAMNVLQGLAAGFQLAELEKVSYQPLAEVFRAIAPVERRHAELGVEGLAQLATTDAGRAALRDSLAYWWPRVAEGFGPAGSARFDRLKALGLRHRPNEALLADWSARAKAVLAEHAF